MDLSDCRVEIDRIDRQLIQLLEERFDVAHEICVYKQRVGKPILDQAREDQKLEALKTLCTEEKVDYIQQILKEIMAQSRRYQKEHSLSYGLLGQSLGHSHSPRIHQLLGGYEYGLFERTEEGLDDFFAADTFKGINVTIPYKRAVMKYCHEISARARACNSVNTIVRREDGSLFGDNTDYAGFRYLVKQSGISVSGKKALIFGSGGVSGTVEQVLMDLGADPVIIVSRSGEDNYENLDRHRDARILVNTTPVGMYPKAGEAVVNAAEFADCQAVFDLIYNPLRSKLMLDAEAAGIPSFGGLSMLVAQAAEAATLFTGQTFTTDRVDEVTQIMQHSLEHLVLIGMPGCGKTSIGAELSRLCRKSFVDMDEEIRIRRGASAEEIIREKGVDAFRNVETEVMKEVLRGAEGPLVIASGGGCVEREENRELIRENATVIYLKRDLTELPINGRPVSQADGLAPIYARRRDRYESWSDVELGCIGVKETAQVIADRLGYTGEE